MSLLIDIGLMLLVVDLGRYGYPLPVLLYDIAYIRFSLYHYNRGIGDPYPIYYAPIYLVIVSDIDRVFKYNIRSPCQIEKEGIIRKPFHISINRDRI